MSVSEYGQSLVDGICECGAFVARGAVGLDYADGAGATHFVCLDCAERIGGGDVPLNLVRAAARHAQDAASSSIDWQTVTPREAERFWHDLHHLPGHRGPHWPIGQLRQLAPSDDERTT